MFPQPPLLAFPPARTVMDASTVMRAHGLSVRPAVMDDLPYLRGLYHDVRAPELAHTDWPDALKASFLDSQFAMQHLNYVQQFADADFWIVEQHSQPVGRYYLRRAARYHIIEISLASQWRGCGMGGMLLDWTQSMVHAGHHDGIDLQVDDTNLAAQRLYRRLGFIEIERQPPRIAMRWTPAAA